MESRNLGHQAKYNHVTTKGTVNKLAFADGHNKKGGFGYGGGVNIDDLDDDKIAFKVRYDWTTSERLKGKIDEQLIVRVGQAVDAQLSDNCRIRIDWR